MNQKNQALFFLLVKCFWPVRFLVHLRDFCTFRCRFMTICTNVCVYIIEGVYKYCVHSTYSDILWKWRGSDFKCRNSNRKTFLDFILALLLVSVFGLGRRSLLIRFEECSRLRLRSAAAFPLCSLCLPKESYLSFTSQKTLNEEGTS